MNPNPLFRLNDNDLAAQLVRDVGFAAIFLSTPAGPRVANVPVQLTSDGRRLRFHLSRGNGLTPHLDGAVAAASVVGPHGYVSPGDYQDDSQVPTWNYVTTSVEGTVRRTDRDELVAIIVDLTAAHERRIAADPEWTHEKMDRVQFNRMVDAIVGFELTISAWHTTAKLSQNKPLDKARLVQAAVTARGQTALGAAMAAAIANREARAE
jgi:transcriptional regulator